MFFGLLFHMGFIKLNHFADYWKNDMVDKMIERVMSRNRFLLILRMSYVNVGEITFCYFKVKNLINYFNTKILSIYYRIYVYREDD